MTSPFHTHRDKVLGYYSTASLLRQAVMSLWSGSAYPVALSKLATLDPEHFAAFIEMFNQYRKSGENDLAFMRLVQDIEARIEVERAADQRAARLESWLSEVRSQLRDLGKPSGLADDCYSWLARRFDAGDTAEAAAAACELPVREHEAE